MTRLRLTGADVMTMAPDRPRVESVDIVVDGTSIGQITEPRSGRDDHGDIETIDLTGKLVMPGLVNAHLHTWQSALRFVGADWSLPEYLARAHGDIAGEYTPEDMFIGTLLGALNQINAGATTIGDWCHNCSDYERAAAAVEGLARSGVRATFFHGTPHGLRDRPHDTKMFDEIVAGPITSSPLLTAGMAIKGPTLSSERIAIGDLIAARERGVVATMHQSSGIPGDSWDAVTRHGLWGPSVNIVHGTSIKDDLMRCLIDHGVTFTATPENEQGQGHCTNAVEAVLRHGGRLSMGTDSDAFVSGDVRTAARLALSRFRATQHDTARGCTGSVVFDLATTQWDALSWVTGQGARAVGLADRIGMLAPGMAADLIVLDARDISTWPHHDALAVALHAHPGVVESVMIDGTWRKRDGVLVGVDVAGIQESARASGERLVSRLRSTSLPRRVRRRIVERVVERSLAIPPDGAS